MSTTTPRGARGVAGALGAAVLALTLLAGTSDALAGQAAGRAGLAKVPAVGKETVRLKVGVPNRVMPEQDLYKIQLPKGDYEVQVNGLFDYDGSATSASVTCLVFDKRLVPQLSSPDPDYRLLYAADGMSFSSGGSSTWDSIIDSTNVVTLTRARTVIYGCTAFTDGTITQLAPMTVHFTKLAGIDQRSVKDYVLPTPRPATKGDALSRLFR